MVEVEVQNETYQTQEIIRFAVVPRIGEGIRLLDQNGFWASFDVVDVWYQKASHDNVWVPYIHVRLTPGETPVKVDDGVDLNAEVEVARDHPLSKFGLPIAG